jgi:hypothetical protein
MKSAINSEHIFVVMAKVREAVLYNRALHLLPMYLTQACTGMKVCEIWQCVHIVVAVCCILHYGQLKDGRNNS